MHCDNIQETRGAVMFTDEEYSKEADTVGLGMARPPTYAGRAKRSLSVSLMLSRPVMEGMKWSLTASSSGWINFERPKVKGNHCSNISTSPHHLLP